MILQGARRQVMSSKRGNKNYYKGRGCNPTGFHTRKGGYRIDPYRVVHFVVPELGPDEPLKPYVSYKAAKVLSSVTTPEDVLGLMPDAGEQVVGTDAPAAEKTSPSSFFSGIFGGNKKD